MTRRVTLFTGQWADLPFEEVCRLASEWEYDGLEVACWGDHLDVVRAAEDDAYVGERRDLLEKHGLGLWAISNHLTGQLVCDDLGPPEALAFVRRLAFDPPPAAFDAAFTVG
jgi:sugar phosphate isomerase/epimerase